MYSLCKINELFFQNHVPLKINAKMLWIYMLMVALIFSQLNFENKPRSYLKCR